MMMSDPDGERPVRGKGEADFFFHLNLVNPQQVVLTVFSRHDVDIIRVDRIERRIEAVVLPLPVGPVTSTIP
jgi:hypothetical protein